MFNKGGQRRTLETPCGWRCVGHPQEVNGKYRIHKKFCDTCKDVNNVPEFSRTNGDVNGWKGISNKNCNQRVRNIVTTCVVDGERFDVIQEAKTIDDATKKIRENEEILDTIADVIKGTDKKKRKRVKKLTKKTNNDSLKQEEILTDAVLKYINDDTIDKFCDKYEDDDKLDEKAEWELANILGHSMSEDELRNLVNSLYSK